MPLQRRQFLKSGGLAAAGTLLIPRFLQALQWQQGSTPLGGERVLVVIQLSGGNDGLNTVIPFQNDIYYQLRPKLALPKAELATLTQEAALHPSLSAFRDLYNNGELTILNNVGYPNPDRSHFRSMDIWHTASASNEYLHTGWLGRYLDATCIGCTTPTQVLELDDTLSLALKGAQHKGISFKEPGRLYTTSQSPAFAGLLQQHTHGHHPMADYLYRTLADTLQSADAIHQAAKKQIAQPSYPNSGLARSLKTIGSLIGGGLHTSVYYASIGSFDTHINQQPQHQRLLKELNDAVAAFVADLKQQNRFNDVLIMTFSEFGRRAAQNASGGTDHGTANNMFLIGGALQKKGLYNPMPSLQNLDNGDLMYQIDFRSVYHTILQNWLQTNASQILGKPFQSLSFV